MVGEIASIVEDREGSLDSNINSNLAVSLPLMPLDRSESRSKTALSLLDKNNAYLGRKIVQEKFAGFESFAIVTLPYRQSWRKNFEVTAIPRTYVSHNELSASNLSDIPLDSIVGLGCYHYDPGHFDIGSFFSPIADDMRHMGFCDGAYCFNLAIGFADAVRTQNMEKIDYGSRIYALFTDNKPGRFSDISCPGGSFDDRSYIGSKSICIMYKPQDEISSRDKIAAFRKKAQDRRC